MRTTKHPALRAVPISALLLALAPASNASSADEPWYERALLGMEVGPTGAQFGSDPSDAGYAKAFDGREVVRRCAAAGCEYVVIWARDGEYAYYDSKLMPKCPGLGERDVLREAVDEGKKLGLPIIAYCVVQAGGHAYRNHPDWRMLGPDGKPVGRMCFNTGYAEFVKGLLAEMLPYGIDGFHVDMLEQGFGPPYGCWCPACRALFEADQGRPMPPGPTWDESWDRMLEFRYRTSARFERALAAHVRSLRPSASIDFNYHGNPPFSFETGQRPVEHAGNGDFVTGETGVWGFSALGVGLNVEFYRTAARGQRVQVAMQRGVRMYHDQTTRPLEDIRWELLTLLAHGAFVTMVDKTGYDGWLDPVAYERIGSAFADARALREHFGHKPHREVGIYFSSRTRDWYGREDPARYFQSFEGAHRALVLEHIPYGVLLDENATLDDLRAFPVVCLPNVAILSDREVRLFREYVEGGGALLVTGETGTRGPRGERLGRSVLAELSGAEVERTLDSLDNHVRFPSPEAGGGPPPEGPAARLASGIPRGWPFLVKGPACVLRPAGGTAIGDLLAPHRTVRQLRGEEGTDWPMSAGERVGPAAVSRRAGRGAVLVLAASPDFATASEHAIQEARRLFANAVRLLHPEPLVEIEAPANVEAVVTEDPRAAKLRVHWIAYNPTPRSTPARNRPYVLPGLIEDPPSFRAAVRIRREIRGVRAARPSTVLAREGPAILATVNGIHEVLEISY